MTLANTSTPAVAKAALKEDFPDWRIIVSDKGRWWGQLWPLPRDQFNRVNLVDADTAEGLRAELDRAVAGSAR
ncbi:hypothetical protein [Actinomadura sp. 7K507]|uniref:hypothetical protein n=1 Tax=Actinomadura sp. 7K507 TaxID=2530365 RepID=UPI00104D80E7|nr:hypothetical protein [Actinomadura sp. 7K507]TDC81850.1 hypothetical protein E1285_31830 [Actinomadura sp. 7K507]